MFFAPSSAHFVTPPPPSLAGSENSRPFSSCPPENAKNLPFPPHFNSLALFNVWCCPHKENVEKNSKSVSILIHFQKQGFSNKQPFHVHRTEDFPGPSPFPVTCPPSPTATIYLIYTAPFTDPPPFGDWRNVVGGRGGVQTSP